MTRRPAHSGGLIPWERMTFGLALVGMAALVALLTLGAVHAGSIAGRRADLAADHPPAAGAGSDSVRQSAQPGPAAGQGTLGSQNPAESGAPQPGQAPAPAAQQHAAVASDLALAARLGAALRPFAGHLAVGVADRATGAWAIYNGSGSFRAAGLARPDIMADLLMRAQASGTAPDGRRELAAWRQLSWRSRAARGSVWAHAGGAAGLAAANRRLGLTGTSLRPADLPDLSGTTAADQLRLLADVTSARSPLRPASRACELRLLRGPRRGRSWLRTAAAADGVRTAGLANGAGRERLWTASGIGVLHRGGQELLVTVLADSQRARTTALAEVRLAARVAARQITAAPPAAQAPFPGAAILAR
ncbi:MAG TPA: hypothetical protein VGI64_18935 [Streptosporangiaceae bacterium]|jgi:hypothetical protein